MLRCFIIASAFCVLTMPARADDSVEANKLFVEAVRLFQISEGEFDAQDKLSLLKRAEGNLEVIIARYPGTDLAVKLISGQAIGTVSFMDVGTAVERAASAACVEVPDYTCLIAMSLSTARMIESVDHPGWALAHVAEAQAAAGDIEAALSTAQMIENVHQRGWALGDITRAQAEAGDVEAALSTARMVESVLYRGRALSLVARAQAAADDVEAALVTARLIDNKSMVSRANTLLSMVEIRAESGDIAGALSIAGMMKNGSDRAAALARVAHVQFRNGDNVDAKQTVAKSHRSLFGSKGRVRLDAVTGVVAALAEIGGIELALSTARAFDARARAVALAKIAEVQAANDNGAGAQHTISAALSTAAMVNDALFLAFTLSDISEAQAAIGEIEAALTITQTIDEPYKGATLRSSAVAKIAEIQAKSGDISGALTTARTITTANDVRDAAFVEIAEVQAKTGDIEGALSSAMTIEVARFRVRALSRIALSLSRQ